MLDTCTYSQSIALTCKPEMCEADAFYYTNDCSYGADSSDCSHG
jgi:hypothetical protein